MFCFKSRRKCTQKSKKKDYEESIGRNSRKTRRGKKNGKIGKKGKKV